MKRIEGTAGIKLIECVSPAKDKWRIRWDVNEKEFGLADYMEAEFDHRPTADEILSVVFEYYNNQTDNIILSGCMYEGNLVWLSRENQFNYKAAFDRAWQTNGKSLPIKVKLGTDKSPVYRDFNSLNELTDFYTTCMQHIQTTLESGWRKKDEFNLSLYVE